MTVLNDNSKVTRIDAAFGDLIKEYVAEGLNKKAEDVLSAFSTLGPDSKVRLFDILIKN